MKQRLILILLMGVVIQGYAAVSTGDVNGSSTIDIVDALLVAQYYVGLYPPHFDSPAADVNSSGEIDILDALLISQYYVGLITRFPVRDGVTTHDTDYYKSEETYTINYPFPQAGKINTQGCKPTIHSREDMNRECQKAFEAWVTCWITEDGCPAESARPHMGPGPGIPYYAEPYGTLSEFIGWGLIVSVLMDNDQNRTKKLFEYFNNFRKAYTNEYGLMMSTIKFNSSMDTYNKDSAAEADENMAMALIMAHYQWGSDGSTKYLMEAAGILQSISSHLVERPAYVLKPAATWGGSDCLDPCYYDPMYYPLWSNLTGDSVWTKLDDHYRSLVTYFCDHYKTGLLPDWCKADGTATGLADKPYIYSWDAHQISTKWAIYYTWFGTGQTNVFFNAARMFAAWVRKEANGNLSTLVDSYTPDGSPVGEYSHLPALAGAMGLSGIVSEEYQDLVNDGYEYLLTLDAKENYNWGSSLGKVVQLLVYSGNFVNFTGLETYEM